MVFGWLGSGPFPSRPFTRVDASQEIPTVAHLGTCSVASKTAVCAPPPPVGFTVSGTFARRGVDPLVPATWTPKRPGSAPADAETVSVLVAVALAGGVAEPGLNEQVEPAGMPVQARRTALGKPLADEIVQVLVVLPPWAMVKLEGLHETLKSGVGVPPHASNLNEPMRVDQLEEGS